LLKKIDAALQSAPEAAVKMLALVAAAEKARGILARGEEADAHLNLEGAITDINHTGVCDKVSRRTLGRVANQIARAQMALTETKDTSDHE
jgi:hypothetical protein